MVRCSAQATFTARCCANSVDLNLVAGMDKFFRHLSNENGRILFHKPGDTLVAAECTNQPATLLLCVTYRPQDSQQIQASHCILMIKLLFCT